MFFATYADNTTTQGWIGQFLYSATNKTLLTGDPAWQVCATGTDKTPNCAGGPVNNPTLQEVDAAVVECNKGTSGSSYSKGWTGTTQITSQTGVLAVGEDNTSAAGDFGLVCSTGPTAISSSAKWMWYNPDNRPDPFVAPPPPGEFLLFRIPMCSNPVVPTDCTVSKVGRGKMMVPSLGIVPFSVTGTATTRIAATGNPNLFATTMLSTSEFGTVSGLGDVTISLDPRFTSTGTVPSSSYPTLHQHSVHAQIVCRALGSRTLVSDDAIALEAPIDNGPPTATYVKTGNPVAFYALGDASKTTVATLTEFTVDVQPSIGDAAVPTLSQWGVVVLVLLMFGVSFVLLKRKRLVM